MNVLTPDAFNERFTLYRNVNGEPVQRCLREMTAAEVMQAIAWHSDEADRLTRAAAPADALLAGLEAGTINRDDVIDQIGPLVEAKRQAAAAEEACVRLAEQVHVILIPHWRQHPGMRLSQALRRWWPGGR